MRGLFWRFGSSKREALPVLGSMPVVLFCVAWHLHSCVHGCYYGNIAAALL
jgi:hypothetical protein